MTSNNPGTGCGPKEDVRQISVISSEMRGEQCAQYKHHPPGTIQEEMSLVPGSGI